MHYLMLKFTNVVFSAMLQTADSPHGPWQDSQLSVSQCAETHTFAVPMTNTHRFFRLRLLDNGQVPTPELVHAVKASATSIHVSASMQFDCHDDLFQRTEFWRSHNGGEFIHIRSMPYPWFTDTALAPGTYRYRARIEGGKFSGSEAVVTIP